MACERCGLMVSLAVNTVLASTFVVEVGIGRGLDGDY